MVVATNEKELREFYTKWSPLVFRVCRLFLGNDAEAEKATEAGFLTYFERELDLDRVALPILLLIFALEAGKRYCASIAKRPDPPTELGEAILLLPCDERAVFILRNIAGLDELTVGEIVELPIPEVRKRWFQSLMHLRELMPKESLKERNA
jgi:hypothetical protein